MVNLTLFQDGFILSHGPSLAAFMNIFLNPLSKRSSFYMISIGKQFIQLNAKPKVHLIGRASTSEMLVPQQLATQLWLIFHPFDCLMSVLTQNQLE